MKIQITVRIERAGKAIEQIEQHPHPDTESVVWDSAQPSNPEMRYGGFTRNPETE